MIRIKLFLSFLVTTISLLISSCQTGYHAQSTTGGYTDFDSEHPNIFNTGFNGNGHTSADRAYDLAKLRSAEKAWRRGYYYFVELQANTQVNHTGNVNTATAVPMYGGGAFAIGSSTPIYAPSSGISIIGFSKKPPQNSFKAGVEIFNTEDFIESMVTRYRAKVDLDITNPNGPTSDFEDFIYKLTANQDNLRVKDKINQSEITFYDLRKRDATQQESWVGQSSFRYTEFPYSDINDSKAFLSKIAKRQNSNVVVIFPSIASGEDAKNYIQQRGVWVGFGIKRESRLGITPEPGLLKDKIFQVRSIAGKDSLFKLGDRILEINGKDTLTIRNDIPELYYDKKPGEIVEVKVARNGEMKVLSVPMLKL
jgi:hypothetical protein